MTSQAILVPAGGIDTEDGPKSYDEVCADLAKAVQGFLAKPEVATPCSAPSSPPIRCRASSCLGSGSVGKVILASTGWKTRNSQSRSPYPGPPACDAADEKPYMEERFGPITFVVRVADTASAIALSERIVSTHGALTVGVYSTGPR